MSETTPTVPSCFVPTDEAAAVLLAVFYAHRRWADPSLGDVINQLAAPRLSSGMGVLPAQLTGSQVERLLTTLRKAGLIASEPARTRRGRRWTITTAGCLQVEQLRERIRLARV